MDVRTYRAESLADALELVRRDLGPDAAILRTRELPRSLWHRLRGARPRFEVSASLQAQVPSRLPRWAGPSERSERPAEVVHGIYRRLDQDQLRGQLAQLHSMVAELCEQTRRGGGAGMSQPLWRVFTDLVEQDVPRELARELVRQAQEEGGPSIVGDAAEIKRFLASSLATRISATGPLRVEPGRRRVVALVGPTGVGKTTTVAKLAAIYRLTQKRRLGLITMDTYRIAAVEQLRTYANIIEVPMEVVSTPRDVREAIERMSAMELVLIDTGGRNPTDSMRLRELRALLNEAHADEVHLVLASVAGATSLVRAAQQFRDAQTTALLITKLDESATLGNLLPLLREARVPLSYLTTGQNVPDDIQVADPNLLARRIIGLEHCT